MFHYFATSLATHLSSTLQSGNGPRDCCRDMVRGPLLVHYVRTFTLKPSLTYASRHRWTCTPQATVGSWQEQMSATVCVCVCVWLVFVVVGTGHSMSQHTLTNTSRNTCQAAAQRTGRPAITSDSADWQTLNKSHGPTS
jgi:hypothetical protein